jgi:hypothetical protein
MISAKTKSELKPGERHLSAGSKKKALRKELLKQYSDATHGNTETLVTDNAHSSRQDLHADWERMDSSDHATTHDPSQ